MARMLARSLLLRYRALFLDARLFDGPELEVRSIASVLVVREHVLAAIPSLAHETHRFLPELIAAHREIVAIAERMPL